MSKQSSPTPLPASRPFHYQILSLAIILMITLMAASAQASVRPKPIGKLSMERSLTARFDERSEIKFDSIDSPRAAVYQLVINPTDTVTIDAESDEVNLKLRLIDQEGKTLVEDDDGGVGHNAHLVLMGGQFDTAQAKELLLEVSSQGQWDQGRYTLTIKRGEHALPQGKEKIAADIEYCQRAVALAGNEHRQGWVESSLAYYNSLLARYDQVHEHALNAQQLAEKVNDRRLLAAALKNLGAAAWYRGQAEAAIPLFEQSLKLRRELGDRKGEANSLDNLGIAYQQMGKPVQAIVCFEQAMNIYRELKDEHGVGNEFGHLGIVYYTMKDYDRAIQLYEQSLRIRRELRDRRGEAYDLGNLGVVYAKLGQYQRAIVYYEMAIQLRRALGDRRGEQIELMNLAKACVYVGEINQAVEYKKASDRIKVELEEAR